MGSLAQVPRLRWRSSRMALRISRRSSKSVVRSSCRRRWKSASPLCHQLGVPLLSPRSPAAEEVPSYPEHPHPRFCSVPQCSACSFSPPPSLGPSPCHWAAPAPASAPVAGPPPLAPSTRTAPCHRVPASLATLPPAPCSPPIALTHARCHRQRAPRGRRAKCGRGAHSRWDAAGIYGDQGRRGSATPHPAAPPASGGPGSLLCPAWMPKRSPIFSTLLSSEAAGALQQAGAAQALWAGQCPVPSSRHGAGKASARC